MYWIERVLKGDKVRFKIRRELSNENWPDVTEIVNKCFPNLVQHINLADSIFEDMIRRYPIEYYELFVKPSIIIMDKESAISFIKLFEELTNTKIDQSSFKICYEGKHYTISLEYPCG